MITYHDNPMSGRISVKLDGKVVGHIQRVKSTLDVRIVYVPKGQGVVDQPHYGTLDQCKRAIEGGV